MQTRIALRAGTNALAWGLLLSVVTTAPSVAFSDGATTDYALVGDRIAARFQVANGSLKVASVEDRSTHSALAPREIFTILLRDGRAIAASQLHIDAEPVEQEVSPQPNAARLAERTAGQRLCARLGTENNSLTVRWCAELRTDANYLRQEITLQASDKPVDIAEVRLFDFDAPGAHLVGKVAGSPIVAGSFFFGFESPQSVSSVTGTRAKCVLRRVLPLAAGQSITYSSVVGVASPGQLRRDFLAYLEQERAHPYHTFLHYNTWYDIGYGERFNEAQVLDRVHAFGEELVHKRGVTVASFLLDDGWDDTHSLWHVNPGFPDGFTHVSQAASKYGIGIGLWLSPWGGYEAEKQQRIEAGTKEGFETVNGGFALSGPRYYERFETTCLEMISKYGVNQFKFDGTGNAGQVFPGSLFDSDFSAAIHLIGKLRERDPEVFINLTTGTWPSPFWLRYADSIWRGGDDHSFNGVGSWRQKWITYRDEQTYRNVVEAGPLFPLSSLMLHGMIYADKAEHLNTDPDHDFPDEVRSYFGSGTQLQEMYITPSLLSTRDWDLLAEAARWSNANAATLKDTHWIGGDPGKLEVYGWAAWSPKKGIVVLRNPSNRAQEFSLDVAQAFELPQHAPQSYLAQSPWASDHATAPINLHAGEARHITLPPFQVLTLDATPAN